MSINTQRSLAQLRAECDKNGLVVTPSGEKRVKD